MEKPCIIVTSGLASAQEPESDIDVWRYVKALYHAGADPMVVAKGDETAHALRHIEARGVVFTGGGDICAHHYDGRNELCSRVDLERDAGEIELFQEAYFNNMPILGICRGMQLANVALGGSLIEDIPNHHSGESGPERFDYTHKVRILSESRLAKILHEVAMPAESLQVNSVHHQAINQLSARLAVCAESEDGIIEAIESERGHPGYFLAVQWHPEAMPPGDAASRAIFTAFLEASRPVNREAATH